MREGWTYRTLEEVCNINYGTRVVQKKDKGTTYYVYGGGGATFMIDRYNREDCFIVSRFAMSPQCTRYVKGKFFLNDSGLSVSTNNKLLLQPFLDKTLFAYNDIIYSLGKGMAQRNLDMPSFKKIIIPIPPLSEQQRIVSELDLLSSIIEKKKAQLKEYDQLAQSIFYDMFGDPVSNEKGWEVMRLGDEFEVSSGGTPSTKKSEYWDDGNISWIGSNMCQNQIIFENDGKYITKEGLEHSSAKLYKKGFVLIALVGATIGKVALLNFATTTNQNIAGVNVPSNKDFDPMFVFYLIQSLYCFFENIGDGKFKMANLSFVRSLPIIKPSYEIQQSFASKIEAIERQKALIQQSITEAETLFNSRMDYYFN